MKSIFSALMLIITLNGMAQETEIRKSIDTFFEAFHARDTIRLKTVLHKDMVMQSVSEKKSGAVLSVEPLSAVLSSIASIPPTVKFEEKLLSYKILIDGSMAHAWTPYEFYVDGKLSHSGVNSFQLFNDDGFWKIVYCIDTRRK